MSRAGSGRCWSRPRQLTPQGRRRAARGGGLRLVARPEDAAGVHQYPAGLAPQHPGRLLGARPHQRQPPQARRRDAKPSTLMFAKFSPDGGRVAYVRENNLYVEDLASGAITPLTTDGSRTMINGTFDWVYEEELMNYYADGWRWSPDGASIAYWQLNADSVRNFTLVNNTDSLYSQGQSGAVPQGGRGQLRCQSRHRAGGGRAHPLAPDRGRPPESLHPAHGLGRRLRRGDPAAAEPAAEHRRGHAGRRPHRHGPHRPHGARLHLGRRGQ